jgi:HPt (histidine-containing phosphotransfer) domain-containing protein
VPPPPDSLSPKAAPLDLERLRAQTGGDAGLEREVLALFLTKSEVDLQRIVDATTAVARRESAHALVGSARAIGADAVAETAREIERGAPAASVALLRDALDVAHAFIRRRLSS